METEFVWYDIRKKPFAIYGLYRPETEPLFRRLPEALAERISPKVAMLSRQPSGGCIRFSTDSPRIRLRVTLSEIYRYPITTSLMASGFDLYEDTDEGSRYLGSYLPPVSDVTEYELERNTGLSGQRAYTLVFPLRCTVSSVLVGLDKGAVLAAGREYRPGKPVVVYGSSIVQGVAATRPGMVYPSLLSRSLDRYVMNFGFAGGAHAEPEMMRYLAELPMSVFVYDYDHNSANAEDLRQTHQRGFEVIRAAQPELPVILISRPNASTNPVGAAERKEVVYQTYLSARAAGDRRVYYIDGDTFFAGRNRYECTSDCVHPNDLGYARMAEVIEGVIRQALDETR